jgi:UDP-GlcNAc:undecaprenyl-phosphate/decaprenyl-phosphate GlcNAc-1-phosphate transferase
MYAILVLGITAFLFCLILTPLCRDLFLRLNIVDRPDTERKFHRGRIPRIGGIPIVLSYIGGLGLLLFLAPTSATISVQHRELLWSLLPATGLVFLTGVIDDIFGLKPWQKLAGQTAAAVLAISLGARLAGIQGHATSIWFSVPLSLLWLLTCTNALNLIDGMDGLASGVGLLATLATLLAAIFSHNLGLAMATVPLVGCLLAFLLYNFNPASIFLGDCGSLTIGFMLGCFGLIWSRRSGSMLGIAAPLMTLALPLIDVCLSIGRRYLRSVPIFQGDRGHIHHMIVARGFNQKAAALIMYGVCVIAALLALMETFGGYRFHGLIIAIFCVLVFVGVNYLGYVEISAARRTLSRKMVLSVVKEEIYLTELTKAIAKVTTLQESWTVVLTVCKDMNFATVQMRMHGVIFEEVLNEMDEEKDSAWNIALTLGQYGSLRVARSAAADAPSFMMRALVHLQHLLEQKDFTDRKHPSDALKSPSVSGAA